MSRDYKRDYRMQTSRSAENDLRLKETDSSSTFRDQAVPDQRPCNIVRSRTRANIKKYTSGTKDDIVSRSIDDTTAEREEYKNKQLYQQTPSQRQNPFTTKPKEVSLNETGSLANDKPMKGTFACLTLTREGSELVKKKASLKFGDNDVKNAGNFKTGAVNVSHATDWNGIEMEETTRKGCKSKKENESKTEHDGQENRNKKNPRCKSDGSSVRRATQPLSRVSNTEISNKPQINSDDIKTTPSKTLHNRIKRYQGKLCSLRRQDNTKEGQIKTLKQTIANIRKELSERQISATNVRNTKAKYDIDDEQPSCTKPFDALSHSKITEIKVPSLPGKCNKAYTCTNTESANGIYVEDQVVKVKDNTTDDGINHADQDNIEIEQDAGHVGTPLKSKRSESIVNTSNANENGKQNDLDLAEIEVLFHGIEHMLNVSKVQNKKNQTTCNGRYVHRKLDVGSSIKNEHNITKGAGCEAENSKSVFENSRSAENESNILKNRSSIEDKQKEPSVNEVFTFMVKNMEGRGKPEAVASNSGLFPPHYDSDSLESWFQANADRFTLIKRKGILSYVIVFKSSCKVCLAYSSEKGCTRIKMCHSFHMCRDFLSGYCKYEGNVCKYSHDISDKYNINPSTELGYNKTFNKNEIRVMIRARYPIVCQSWNTGQCYDLNCTKLHICHKHIIGECQTGSQCLFSHDRFTDHNKPIVDAYAMGHWNEKLFCKTVIIERQPPKVTKIVVPVVNLPDSSDKCLGATKHKKGLTAANKVHITNDISLGQTSSKGIIGIRDTGTTAPQTRRTEIGGTSVAKIVKPGHTKEPERPVSKGRNSTASETALFGGSKLSGIRDDTVICDLDLDGGCSDSQCRLFHNRSTTLPYIWQVKLFGDWITLTEELQENIERRYCDLKGMSNKYRAKHLDVTPTFFVKFKNGCIYGYLKVDETDKYQRIEARRISTPSYVKKKTIDSGFKTGWRWYWKNDLGQWILFKEDTVQYTLETKYLAGQAEYLFPQKGYIYVVHFQRMTQTNQRTNKCRDILRRPLHVTASDVRHGRTATKLHPFPVIEVHLPNDWVPWDHTSHFELVKLPSACRAYMDTVGKFFRTMSSHDAEVECVYRIQSHGLWDAFYGTEKHMTASLERTRPGAVLERRDLFHGTGSMEDVRGICTHNFDQRVSGKHGTKYGDGVYFARKATYSHKFTKGPTRLMFLVHVLVGQFARGEREYRRPPVLPGSQLLLYDSCVDNVDNARIFILFEKSQYYPAYLIQYKDKQRIESHRQISTPRPNINIANLSTRVNVGPPTSSPYQGRKLHTPVFAGTSHVNPISHFVPQAGVPIPKRSSQPNAPLSVTPTTPTASSENPEVSTEPSRHLTNSPSSDDNYKCNIM